MIRKVFFIIIFFSSTLLVGQFESNKHNVGPSFGFSFLGSTFQVGANHEYGINLADIGINGAGKIGIGAIFRYWNYSEETVNVNRDYKDIIAGLQTNYHFYMPNDRVDPWIGLILAYDFGYQDVEIKTIGFKVDDESYGGFWIGAQAGSRYWIAKNLALSLRIGFGIDNYGFIDFGFDYQIN
jgi:hypothetical protein